MNVDLNVAPTISLFETFDEGISDSGNNLCVFGGSSSGAANRFYFGVFFFVCDVLSWGSTNSLLLIVFIERFFQIYRLVSNCRFVD